MKAHKNGRLTVQLEGLNSTRSSPIVLYSLPLRVLQHSLACPRDVTSSVSEFLVLAWTGMVWGSVDQWVGVAAEGTVCTVGSWLIIKHRQKDTW